MDVVAAFPLADEILRSYSSALGKDLIGYRNHVFRVLNYFAALSGTKVVSDSVQIACAFHDIGIWTSKTFDYIEPSVAQCAGYLAGCGRAHCAAEANAIITQHHKLTPYRQQFAATAEPFRKADLVDVSGGLFRFEIPKPFVRSVKTTFPDAGFHWRLTTLAARQLLLTPTRPLPMLRW